MPINDIKFRATGKKVVIEGKAAPNSTVKAENLSVAPFQARWNKDSFTTAKADASGNFRITVRGGAEGDKVRVSAKGDAGQVVVVRVNGKDTRRAEFNVQSLRLQEAGAGAFSIGTVSANDVAGEPGETIRLTNERTGQSQQVKLDATGRFPASLRISGQPGDVIALAATDGTNNAKFADSCGCLVVPPRRGAEALRTPIEPAPALEDRSKVTTVKLTAPLFVDGAAATDPCQGGIGDCYLVATASSLAQTRPELLQKLIRDNGDGTFTVTFKRWDAKARAYVDEAVTVTNSFPGRYGQPYYGSGANNAPAAKRDLWFPVLEKAYASWKGGYDAIRSGYPYEIFEACLGTAGRHHDVRVESPKKVFEAMKAAVAAKQPMVAWTAPDSADKPFTNTGLVGDHAYTVLGVEEKDGEKLVTLRNPWGCTEPSGNGPDDGVFTVPWKTFAEYFDGLGVAEG